MMRPLLILLVAFVFIHHAVFLTGRGYFDGMTGASPDRPAGYSGPFPYHGSIDGIAAFNGGFAMDVFLARSVREGSFPFWDPRTGLGQPFLAYAPSAVLYPPNWLHLVIPPRFWDLIYFLNWFLGGYFLYRLLAIWNIERWCALAGALAFFVSGYIACYLNLRELPAVAIWWPLLIYCVERSFSPERWRLCHLVLAVAVFCSITGGQPEVTFVSLASVFGYALVRLYQERLDWRRAIHRLAWGSLAGVLVAAPFWIPFIQYVFGSFSARTENAGHGTFALGFSTITSYFIPFLYGVPKTAPYGALEGWMWDFNAGWSQGITLFLAAISWNARRSTRMVGLLWAIGILAAAKIWGFPGFNELLGSLPLLRMVVFPRFGAFLLTFAVCLLAPIGLSALVDISLARFRNWVIGWAAFSCAMLAIGIWPVGFKNWLNNSEAASLGALGLAWLIIGPLALYYVRKTAERHTFFLVAIAGILFQGIATLPYGYAPAEYRNLSLLMLAGFGVMAYAAQKTSWVAKKGAQALLYPLLIPALLAGGAGLATMSRVQGLPKRYDPLPEPAYLTALRTMLEGDMYRVYSWHGYPSVMFGAGYGISSLSFQLGNVPEPTIGFFRNLIDTGASMPLFLGGYAAQRTPGLSLPEEQFVTNRRYYNLLAVRYLVTRDMTPERFGLELVFDQEGTRIWRDPLAGSRVFFAPEARSVRSWQDALQQLSSVEDLHRTALVESAAPLLNGSTCAPDAPCASIEKLEITPNTARIVARTNGAGVLTLTDAYDSGWTASVDGEPTPVIRVDGAFKGVLIDSAGEHEVIFKYVPPYWQLALMLAAIGTCALIAITIHEERA
jgi:hypothetical protein